MSDEAKKTEKTSWFQGLKAEFKNIKFAYPNLAKYEKDYLDIVQNHII